MVETHETLVVHSSVRRILLNLKKTTQILEDYWTLNTDWTLNKLDFGQLKRYFELIEKWTTLDLNWTWIFWMEPHGLDHFSLEIAWGQTISWGRMWCSIPFHWINYISFIKHIIHLLAHKPSFYTWSTHIFQNIIADSDSTAKTT